MKTFQPQRVMNRAKKRRYPELVPTPEERQAGYYTALELVAMIDENLTRDIYHYRNRAGVLLETLDQVVHAILNDDLLLPIHQRESEPAWTHRQELAA